MTLSLKRKAHSESIVCLSYFLNHRGATSGTLDPLGGYTPSAIDKPLHDP